MVDHQADAIVNIDAARIAAMRANDKPTGERGFLAPVVPDRARAADGGEQ